MELRQSFVQLVVCLPLLRLVRVHAQEAVQLTHGRRGCGLFGGLEAPGSLLKWSKMRVVWSKGSALALVTTVAHSRVHQISI